MRARIVATAIALASLAATSAARANPVETFGLGSRSTAMGNAVTADATDFSANYYNPAGLVGQKHLLIELGYVFAHHSLAIDGKDNHVDDVRGMMVGIVAPGEVAKVPFAFGIGIHLPDERVFRVRALDQTQPRWELYDNRTQRIYFAANLAVKPFPWLEIGGGLSFLAGTRATLDVAGDIDAADPNHSALRHQVDADLGSIRYPQVGVRVLAADNLRFGAVYRGQFHLDIDIDANVRATYIGLPLTSTITTSEIDAFLPQQIAFGASWDPRPDVTVDLDVTWVNWSAYEPPVTRVTADTKIIGTGVPPGLIPDKAAPIEVVPANFHDRFVPRIGAEWRLPLGPKELGHKLALRAGYSYEKTPIPEQRGVTNYVDGDRHALSAGLGLVMHHVLDELPGDLRFDVHAQLSILPERTTHKDDPSDLVGSYTQRGTILAIGSTVGVAF
jgi:long-chain fatty acid transport protein